MKRFFIIVLVFALVFALRLAARRKVRKNLNLKSRSLRKFQPKRAERSKVKTEKRQLIFRPVLSIPTRP